MSHTWNGRVTVGGGERRRGLLKDQEVFGNTRAVWPERRRPVDIPLQLDVATRGQALCSGISGGKVLGTGSDQGYDASPAGTILTMSYYTRVNHDGWAGGARQRVDELRG